MNHNMMAKNLKNGHSGEVQHEMFNERGHLYYFADHASPELSDWYPERDLKINENALVVTVPYGKLYQCGGCSRSYSERGIRAHQSRKFQCMGCLPIWR